MKRRITPLPATLVRSRLYGGYLVKSISAHGVEPQAPPSPMKIHRACDMWYLSSSIADSDGNTWSLHETLRDARIEASRRALSPPGTRSTGVRS